MLWGVTYWHDKKYKIATQIMVGNGCVRREDGKVDRMVTTITVVIRTHKKGRKTKQTVLICKFGWEMVHRVSLWYWGRTE